jgi:acyl transferase domain-containing protein
VGVFVGLGGNDHALRLARQGVTPGEPFVGTGNDPAFAAGRVAHVLGTTGPAVTLDTACSSSLVALHHAKEALRRGEVELALAGGARLYLAPDATAALAALGALSPTGRSRPFDAAADGYVRGEGVVVLALERASSARAAGRVPLAVVRGSAVGHDGAAAGLTVPSGPAQARVIRAALVDAGLGPDDVDGVEAHGTGTALGDPIEAGALVEVFGGRTRPLHLGVSKAFWGHTELAAGGVAVAHALVGLRRGSAGHPAFAAWSPRVPAGPLTLEAGRALRVVGVSAFGLSGTNAHVVLEGVAAAGSAPVPPAADGIPAPSSGWCRRRLGWGLADLPEVRVALREGPPRVAVVGTDDERAAAWAGARSGRFEGEPVAPGVVFVLAGAGGGGSVAEALDAAPSLAAALAGIARAVHRAGGGDVVRALRSQAAEHDGVTQFAWQVALGRWLIGLGVVPTAVVGHGVGDAAAAVLAGAWSLDVGARWVVAREAAVDGVPRGRVVAVRAGEAAVRAAIAGRGDVGLVAVHGPEEIVLGGRPAAVDAVLGALGAVTVLPVGGDRLIHTPLAVEAAAGLPERPPAGPTTVRLASSSGARWAADVVGTLRPADAVASVTGPEVGLVLELATHPQLLGVVRRAVDPRGRLVLGAHRADRGWPTLLEAVAQAWARGLPVDPARLGDAIAGGGPGSPAA